jgi:hypothetical protein
MMRTQRNSGVREQIEVINRSSSQAARALRQCGARSGPAGVVLGPMVTFFRSLIARGGALQGIGGIIRSGLEAYEHFVTRLKLWELHNADEDAGRQ